MGPCGTGRKVERSGHAIEHFVLEDDHWSGGGGVEGQIDGSGPSGFTVGILQVPSAWQKNSVIRLGVGMTSFLGLASFLEWWFISFIPEGSVATFEYTAHHGSG